MNKLIAILVLVALLLAGILTFTLYQRQGNNTKTGTDTPLIPTFPGGQSGEDKPVTVETRTGSIQVRDFLNDPVTVKDPVNIGYYYLGNSIGGQDSTRVPYAIMYIEATDYFNVGLHAEPLGKHRREAELFMMQHLGVTEAQMCELKYMVSVPTDVNEEYSSMNLGFSFCPGATPL